MNYMKNMEHPLPVQMKFKINILQKNIRVETGLLCTENFKNYANRHM